MKKGIIPLSTLIFLAGLLAVILLFDDSTLHFFRAQFAQRQHYVERTLRLQKIMLAQQNTVCQTLPLENNDNVRQISINLDSVDDSLAFFLWCQRLKVFKKLPTKGDNQGQLADFIQGENLADFQPHFANPPNPLTANKTPRLYWFNSTQTQWEINGTVQGIVIAEGDLKLTGKGRITGAVITGGALTLGEGVTVAYGKAAVTALVQQYSRWVRAEKSWYDVATAE